MSSEHQRIADAKARFKLYYDAEHPSANTPQEDRYKARIRQLTRSLWVTFAIGVTHFTFGHALHGWYYAPHTSIILIQGLLLWDFFWPRKGVGS